MKKPRQLTPTEVFFHNLRSEISEDELALDELFGASLDFARHLDSKLTRHVRTEDGNGNFGEDVFSSARYCLLYHMLIGSTIAADDVKITKKLAFLDFTDKELSVIRFFHRTAQAHFEGYARFLKKHPIPELLRVIMEEKS